MIDALEKRRGELGRSMAQVAVNWVATQPGGRLGDRRREQRRTSSTATSPRSTSRSRRTLRARLDEASAPTLGPPYSMFTPEYQSWIVSPGLGIGDKPAGYQPPVWNAA